MMGVVSTDGFPVGEFELYGNYAKSEWSSDGRGHQDGWGLYMDDGTAGRYLGREAGSAFGSLRFLAATQRLRDEKGIAIVHVRHASKGSVRVENSHPFSEGRLALAHNGTIEYSSLQDDITDSEQLFRDIARRSQSSSFHDAFAEGVREARKEKFSGIVLLATDGNELYGFRDFNENEDHYTLNYSRDGGSLLLSQVRSPGHEWTGLSKGQMIVVSRDLTYRIEEL